MVNTIVEYTLPDDARDKLGAYMQRVSDNGLADGRFLDTLPSNDSLFGNANHLADHLPIQGGPLLNAVMGQKLRELLPKRIIKALDDLYEGKGAPQILLHNMPLDKVIPPSREIDEKKGWVSEYTMRGLADIMRTEKDEQNKYGFFIPTLIREREAVGSAVKPQTFHSDFEGRAPFSMLGCLRGNEKAHTTSISINDVAADIGKRKDGAHILKLLTDPCFKNLQSNRPILTKASRGFEISWFRQPDKITATDREHEIALSIFEKTLEKHKHPMVFKPGDVFIFANRRLLHAVSGYPKHQNPALWRAIQHASLQPRPANDYDADPQFVQNVADILEDSNLANLVGATKKHQSEREAPLWKKAIHSITGTRQKEAESFEASWQAALEKQRDWEAKNPKNER